MIDVYGADHKTLSLAIRVARAIVAASASLAALPPHPQRRRFPEFVSLGT